MLVDVETRWLVFAAGGWESTFAALHTTARSLLTALPEVESDVLQAKEFNVELDHVNQISCT